MHFTHFAEGTSKRKKTKRSDKGDKLAAENENEKSVRGIMSQQEDGMNWADLFVGRKYGKA